MSKLNLILLGAAVFQVAVLAILSFTGSDGPEKLEPQKLVTWKAEEVTGITIEDPDESGPVRLEKRDGAWFVASADDFPARATLLVDDAEDEADRSGLLDKLGRIEVSRTVVRQEENHAVLKVAKGTFERSITFRGKSGEELGRLFLSRSPSGRETYVRRDGEKEVWETDGITVWNVSAKSSAWVTATFHDVPQDDVTKLTAHHASSGVDYTFERRPVAGETVAEGEEPKTEWWQIAPVEQRADQTEFGEVLRKSCRLDLTDIRGKTQPEDAGFDAGNVFTLIVKDGSSHVLRIGGEIEDGDVNVKVDGNDWWMTVSPWSVRGLSDLDPAKLIEAPEEESEETDEPGTDGEDG